MNPHILALHLFAVTAGEVRGMHSMLLYQVSVAAEHKHWDLVDRITERAVEFVEEVVSTL